MLKPVQIQMDGPHYGRKQMRRKALLRAAVALVIALAIIVGLPMLAGALYARALY